MTHEQEKKPHVGWIGLGKMGTPIVRNLLVAGFDVTVFDVDTTRVDEAVNQGAQRAADIRGLARKGGLIFSIIPDDAVLLRIALGSEGLLDNANEGTVYVDMSTVSPAASTQVRDSAQQRGVGYICAPVSGSTVLAEKAQLTVFASGDESGYERALPVLKATSARQYYVGTDQQARYLKLAINHLVGSTAALLAEALTLGTKGGLDWTEMLAVIGDSVVASPLVKYKLDPLKRRDFRPAFSSRQMLKDMSLVVDSGEAAGVPMPAAALVRRRFAEYVEADGADLDFFSIVRAVESDAGFHN
jgi:3-hydroxyisobutyrate dehydrogenase-like beta-hydroxyacid dehydrogenase